MIIDHGLTTGEFAACFDSNKGLTSHGGNLWFQSDSHGNRIWKVKALQALLLSTETFKSGLDIDNKVPPGACRSHEFWLTSSGVDHGIFERDIPADHRDRHT